MNVIKHPLNAVSAVLACVLAATIGVAAAQTPAQQPSSAAQPQPSSAAQPQPPPAAQPQPPSAAQPQLPSAAQPQENDKNAATYARVCSTCHDGQRILSNRRTKDQWSEAIDKMVERGAQGTDEDFAAVMDYLVGHYGRINVNRGSAKDLATVLKVSDKDAAAIVSYRTEKGPFTDFDALAMVPGIDVEKLKENRDAISF